MLCTISFFLVIHASLSACNQPQTKKTIMLFGIAGVGKSTISNCLLNQKGDADSIDEGGFQVSEDTGSGTLKFEIKANEKFTIIDSIGFGSPDFNGSYILQQMRSVLRRVNNQIDIVLFVIKKGRLTNETYQFIRSFQRDVLRNKSLCNSVLLINHCDKGWIDKPAQRGNPFIRQILASVNNLSYEFDLKMDHWSDESDVKERNVLIRQKSIDDLVEFLLQMNASAIALDHIQTDEFEQTWLYFIYSYLEALARYFLLGFTTPVEAADDAEAYANRFTSTKQAQVPHHLTLTDSDSANETHVTEEFNLMFSGVYAPIQNHIYLITSDDPSKWRYFNPLTGHFRYVKLPSNLYLVESAYSGGVYTPEYDRIYLIPLRQTLKQVWHFIDCATSTLVEYPVDPNFSLSDLAYNHGVYSPNQGCIYLVPFNQQSNVWHYIDCKWERVVEYSAYELPVKCAYSSGVYSPSQNRIYFVPHQMSPQATWHYVDCSTGRVVPYKHCSTASSNIYVSGIYSSVQNRIYFIPGIPSARADLHYIDCSRSVAKVNNYSPKVIVKSLTSGVYAPEQDRIYMLPFQPKLDADWHYIDCKRATLVAYKNPFTPTFAQVQVAVYVPFTKRVFLIGHANYRFHVFNIDARASAKEVNIYRNIYL